jgi:hypothetical protein
MKPAPFASRVFVATTETETPALKNENARRLEQPKRTPLS